MKRSVFAQPGKQPNDYRHRESTVLSRTSSPIGFTDVAGIDPAAIEYSSCQSRLDFISSKNRRAVKNDRPNGNG